MADEPPSGSSAFAPPIPKPLALPTAAQVALPSSSSSSSQSSLTMSLLATPLDRSDLEFPVDDPAFVDDFELAWTEFLKSNPNLAPKGKREERIRQLRAEALEIDEGKLKVLREMERQIEFFKSGCDALEDVYAGKMQSAVEKQGEVEADLKKRLNDVAIADHLQQQTLPWHHFVHEVEVAAREAGESWDNDEELTVDTRNSSLSSLARPSAHARVLTDRSRGSAADILLRSYRIDNALLTTHIRVLAKEIERYERMVKAQELTGKFLRDHNAWAILTKDSNSTSSSSSPSPSSGSLSPSSSSLDGGARQTSSSSGGVTSLSGSRVS